MLPEGDRTPENFLLPVVGWRERFKRPLRRLLYPIFNTIVNQALAARYSRPDFSPDLWLWGQRGNDYARHRRRVNRFLSLRGKNLLIAGCGTGNDVASWVNMRPASISCVDWFSYDKAWNSWRAKLKQREPGVEISFAQGDLTQLAGYEDASIDAICSDAVFEHLTNLPAVLQAFKRILRPGGLIYASFGPLWNAWGGDHVSGYDHIESGYNHLLLEPHVYRQYLDGLGVHHHSEHDGRTWIEHGLFSYLTPRDYLVYLENAGFERLFVAAIIDPRAVACINSPQLGARLRQHDRINLLVSGMTIIYRRSATQRPGV